MKAEKLAIVSRTGQEPDGATQMLFEPFFRKRSESVRIQRLQTNAERRKFADAFAMEGCLHCHSKKRQHRACGLCVVCHRWYKNVLQKVLRARMRGELE